MNIATPAPTVESAVVEPAKADNEETRAEPARIDDEALAEPAKPVEPAELVDDPKKFAASNAQSYLEKKPDISVETLRSQGVDFEARVGVIKGGAPKKAWFKLLLPMFYDQRDFVTFSEIARYIVLQNGCCFVFLESTDLSPLYAFGMDDLTAEIENRDKPDKYSCTVDPCSNTNKTGEGLETVLLRNKRNKKIAYQFTFNVSKDNTVVKRFMDAMERHNKGSKVVRGTVTSGKVAGSEKKQAK